MSEQNAPHAQMLQNSGLGTTEMDKTETVGDSDMTYGFVQHPLQEVHLSYFIRLIAWLQQQNKTTKGRGNAELLALRMFSFLGSAHGYHLKYATGMTMDEVRGHIHNLIDSLPDVSSNELTIQQLWEHRAVLDELRPYLKHIKLQPRSAVKALTWRGSVRKSWRWLSKGY